jgi:hypothetical protein
MNNQAIELAGAGTPQIQNPHQIDMQNLLQEFRLSRSYVEQYTKDFPQLQQLADGMPIGMDPDSPFVGDTTLAGLVRSIPRDSLEQLPTFASIVNGSKYRIPALLCTYLLKKYVFNEDTFGKGLLSTLQIAAEQALTQGYAALMVATGTMYQDFGTTMRLLHYTDTAPEPGIQDHNETSYDYVVANLTPSRVRRILAKAERNQDTTNWNPAALRELLNSGVAKPKDYSQYSSTPRQNAAGEASAPTYEFVTRYPVGDPSEPIITFCPEMEEAPLRVMETRSKWGYSRVMYLVIDPAPLTPFGISRVRLASPNMNLMNIYYGQIAAMLLLNSKPPIFKKGRFTTPVQLKQGVVWETNDPQAEAKLQNLDNGSLQFFPQMAQQFATQIQNIMGGKTYSVNASSKSSFGHTAPGEKRAQQFEDSASNQITKILENFLRQYALVALDTLFAEQEGEDDIIVDDDTKDKINQVEPGYVGDDNKVHMNWDEFYQAIEEWSVEISVSVSKDELEDRERGDLQDMLVVLAQNAKDNPAAAQKVTEITNLLLKDKAPLVKPINAVPTPAALPAGPGGAIAPAAPAAPALPAPAPLA